MCTKSALTPLRLAACSRNPTAFSRKPAPGAVQPDIAGDRQRDEHEERSGQGPDLGAQESVKPGLTRPPGVGRSSSAMPCSTLSMAIVVITGLTPAIAHHPAIDRSDGKAGEQAAGDAERQLRRAHIGGDDEGGEHHGQAHHRADRNVEAAHQQHVELRHGDQRQRRGREQDVAKVERGQEDVGLRWPRRRRRGSSAQPGSRAGSTICCCRPTSVSKARCSSVGGCRLRVRRQALPCAVRNDETMFSSVTSAPVSSRMMRPRENTSTRSQMPASSSASDELTMQLLPSAALARMAR